MYEMNFRNSLYISIAIHFLLFLILSIFFIKNPLQNVELPVVVNIEFETQNPSDTSGKSFTEPSPQTLPSTPKNEVKAREKQKATERNVTTVKKMQQEEEVKTLQPKKEEIEKAKEQVEKPSEEIKKENLKKEMTKENEELLKNIDEAIQSKENKGGLAKEDISGDVSGKGNDPLSGGRWSSRARRTIFFPDIQSRLPAELRKKGIGYSVTAKIRFDKNGLPVYVEIVKSSGNQIVDSIFNSELKKIRVEPVEQNVVDEVIHTFKIYVR